MAPEPTERTSGSTYHRRVGFNPFRKQRTSATDIALVAGFVVLTLLLVAWGFLG